MAKREVPFTKDEVVRILSSHDSVRGDDREAFAHYLTHVFAAAEASTKQIAELIEQNAALAARIVALEAK